MALSYISSLILLGLLYPIAVIVYRLHFHPLAKFPGRRLAVITKWYEAYYDLFVHPGGQYWYEIEKMHQLYGPVVRVNPDEIHILDSAWVDNLYASASQGVRDRYPPAALMGGAPESVFGSVSHVTHRARRISLNPLFSKKAVSDSASIVYTHTLALMRRINKQIAERGHAELRMNYLSLATDTVTDFCFGKSTDLLEDEQKSAMWLHTIKSIATSTPLAKQFPWLIPFTLNLPDWIVDRLGPLARITALRKDLHRQAVQAIKDYADQTNSQGEKDQSASQTSESTSRHLFMAVLSSKVLDPSDKRAERMAQEAFTVLAAGSETTGRILTTATYFILANRDHVLPRLLEELESLMPDQSSRPSIHELEALPWLSAIIKETLRVTSLITSRIPVVAPVEALKYKDWVIPPGTAVSMSHRDIMLDPEVYPEPMKFKPERWLQDDLELMNRNYVPFSRGTFNCIGMNLANAELYIVLAMMFRWHKFDLHETFFARDVEIVRDCFVGEVSLETQGVRIKYANA
ncbi:cytochrome P450 [Xylaria sp. CBS 124048]|nr:cytochrome P450 [Xylaria sp. CBS 124048]